MNRWCCLVFLLIVFAWVSPSYAYQPDRPNNKYGIHLATPDPADIADAAALVNGGGGNWGYVVLVIQENDRDSGKWQGVFDELAEQRLIPVIRLATQPEGANWARPEPEEADSWVSFLNSLDWHVKYKYVVLFNEPNHGTEWGGSTNPESYADVAYSFASKLKAADADFFVMLAGFDNAAPSQNPAYEDIGFFLDRMFSRVPVSQWLPVLDGWASHSYPNGYSGTTTTTGRRSIKAYEWELTELQKKGFTKSLPVFITETGWYNTIPDISDKFRIAYTNVWGPDSRVVAVVPFLLNYQQSPFDIFSWKQKNSSAYFNHYTTVKQIGKTPGEPVLDTPFPFGIPDVTNSNQFQGHIQSLITIGVVTGGSDGYFRPKALVTRGEMAKFIRRAFSFSDTTSCAAFTDVPVSHTFYSDIQTLRCIGVVGGYTNGTFRPGQTVSRGEAAKFIMQALRVAKGDLQYLRYGGSSVVFADVPSSFTFYEPIMAGRQAGILSGFGDGVYKPDSPISREGLSKLIDIARTK